MMELRWLLRAKTWAANPPSARRVVLILGLIAALLVIAGIERFIGWPAWMTLEVTGRGSPIR